MSLSKGEALLRAYAAQNPSIAHLNWPIVVAWRVSADVYAALYDISYSMDPEEKDNSPLFTWRLVCDPTMPEGHAVPLDKNGEEILSYR